MPLQFERAKGIAAPRAEMAVKPEKPGGRVVRAVLGSNSPLADHWLVILGGEERDAMEHELQTTCAPT